MNQTSLVGRPLHALLSSLVGFAEKRGVWSGPLTSSSPELARLWAAPSASTGMGVSESSALNYSVFWACVNNISTDVATFPLLLYKNLSDGGKEPLKDHKLYRILHDEPNPEMDSLTFRGTLTANALTYGNGYAEIVRNGAGQVVQLWPITPNRVSVQRDTRTGVLFYEVTRQDGLLDRVPAEAMFHLQGLGFEGTVGYNIVNLARESIGLGLAAERFGGTFYGNGATFGGVFEHPGRMTEPAIKNFRESVNAQHQGVERAHKFIVVEEGMKYQRLGVQPNEAQFLETRQHQIEEICRWFRMPPHKVQHLIRTSYNSVEAQNTEYVIDALVPWCKRWELTILRKLIAPSERMIQFAKHNINSRMRGDVAARTVYYSSGRQQGYLSADDIRELEDMNPLPEGQGKTYLIAANMAPADRINEIVDKQVEPDPAPVAPAVRSTEDDHTQQTIAAIQAALTAAEARIATHATAAADTLAQFTAAQLSEAEMARTVADHDQRAHEATIEATQLQALLLLATERADREAADKEAQRVAAEHHLNQIKETADAEKEALKVHAEDEVQRVREVLAEAEALAEARAADHAAEQAKANALQARLATSESALSDLLSKADADLAAATLDAEYRRAELEAIVARMAQADLDRQVMAQTSLAADGLIAQLQAQLAEVDARQMQTSETLAAEQAACDAAQTQLAQLQAVLAETQAEAARLDAERLAREVAATQSASEAVAAQQAAADAHRAATEAIEKLSLAVAAADVAGQLLAEETARLSAERAAHAATHVALKETQELRIAQVAASGNNIRARVAYEMGKIVAKESERAERNQHTPAKLKAWAESFYLTQEENVIDALRLDLQHHLDTIGSTDDVDVYARSIVRPHLEHAIGQLRAVANGDPEEYPAALVRLLAKWKRERPQQIVDRLLQEEVAYVRSL